MQDDPSPIEILKLVAAYLRETAVPLLPKNESFHARVTANAVDMVRRQLELQTLGEQAEKQRLIAMLGHDGSLSALNEELCEAIRAGTADVSSPVLRQHLWSTTMAKLAVDQPGYSAYLRELERDPS